MLFSILIPSYNSEKHIDECICSVLEQNEKDFEIIVVDDGSTDNSGLILDNYSKQDSRIKVIHQKNKGLFQTRYVALEAASGEYIIFLDSDDTLKRNMLERLKKEFLSENLDMVIYKLDECYESGKRVEARQIFEHNKTFEGNSKVKIYEKLMQGSDLNSMCIKATRKECFNYEEKNINIPINMGEDLVHTMDPITNSEKIKYINEPLYNYRLHSGSMTKVFDPNVYETCKVIHKILFKYLIKWDLNTEHYRSLIYQRFLKSTASYLLFSKSNIKGKEEKYSNVVKESSKDKMFNQALKYKEGLPFIYKIALSLIKNNRINTLVILKKVIGNVRK